MKVLVDINVVIDVLERHPAFFDDSYAVLRLVAEDEIDGFVAAGSIADIYYILRKSGMTSDQVRTTLIRLTQVIDLCDTTAADVNEALALNMPDVEDAVLAACAKRMRADAIVTRDLHDFAASPIPALSPAQLLDHLKESAATP